MPDYISSIVGHRSVLGIIYFVFYDEDGEEIEVYDENGDEIDFNSYESRNSNGWVGGAMFALIIVALIWGIGKRGKHEGMSAKEWADESYYWEDMSYSCEKKYNGIKDQYEEIDKGVLELDRCLKNKQDNIKDTYQTCLSSGKYSQEQCFKLIDAILSTDEDGETECLSEYLNDY